LEVDSDIGLESEQLASEPADGRERSEPAPRETEKVIDGGVTGQDISSSALDHPADPNLRKGPLQGHCDRHAMEHIADRGQLDDDD
jgi:hypothetical protein